jgi:hypothetical protein
VDALWIVDMEKSRNALEECFFALGVLLGKKAGAPQETSP